MARYYKNSKAMAKAETHAFARDLYAKTRRHVNKLVAAGRISPDEAEAERRRLLRERLAAAGLPIPDNLRED